MPSAPIPSNDAERLESLYALSILDTEPERSFDVITRLASEVLGVPIAVVSLVDKNRQWFKSCVGFDAKETPRDYAFCAHAILSEEVTVVEDARLDERFRDNPAVTGPPYVRFYAGMPIKGGGAFNLGTLCVVSLEPKQISKKDLDLLKDLASLVDGELALRRALKQRIMDQKSLVHAEKMASIGSLAAGIAHEINTPMQFIASNTEFIGAGFTGVRMVFERLQNMPLTPSPAGELLRHCAEVKKIAEEFDLDYMLREVPRAIAQTGEGVRRVTEMMVAMRNFSHEHYGATHEEQLNDAIRTTATLSRNSWKYCAELQMDLDDGLPLIECNLGEINQVLLNLIVNAADAISERRSLGMDELGLIQIRSYRRGEDVVLEIEDDGVGIPLKILPKIFDPFFTTKPVGKGTGQGLAISYNIIVHKHGGRLDVESKVGARRTVVTLVLPIRAGDREGGSRSS